MTLPSNDEENLWISWDDYHSLIARLALNVHESGWKFDKILCLARGGLRVGDQMSRIFDVPLAILATSSYREAAAGMDIPWMLQQWVEKTPDKTCLVFCPFEGDTQSFTYAELFDAARRLAAGLQSRGVKQGEFVLLHMDNSPEFIQSWYACAILGAVVVSTNTRSVSTSSTTPPGAAWPPRNRAAPRPARRTGWG